MVDPQPARMAHVGADEVYEWRIGVAAQCFGIEGRKPPVLPGGIVQVGRRADMGRGDHDLRACPAFRSRHIGADGKVAVKPDGHALRRSRVGGGRKLFVGNPLGPGKKVDTAAVLFGEPCHRRCIGPPIVRRPAPPVGIAGLFGKMLAEGLEAAELLERGALRAPEGFESLSPIGSGRVMEPIEEVCEDCELEGRNLVVVHHFRLAETCNFRGRYVAFAPFGKGGRIDV